MGIQESLAKRRTYYNINKELPVAEKSSRSSRTRRSSCRMRST